MGATLLAGLDEDPAVRLVTDAPARLIPPLRNGQLDAGLLSSIEAFRHPGYTVVQGLGIASCGPVRSVRAFRRPNRPIRTVALDSSSAAAATLLKILLPRRLGAKDCAFHTVLPTLEPDRLDADLVMLIGDHGLRADPGGREVLDLGELWHEWTRLPFVYALWLLAPGADAAVIVPRLFRARDEGLRRQIDDGTGGAVYYEIGSRELQGLRRYHEEALALGLVEPGVEPAYWVGSAKDAVMEGDHTP